PGYVAMKRAEGTQSDRCKPVGITLTALCGFNNILGKGFLQDGRSAFGVKGVAGNGISLGQILGGLGVGSVTPKNRYDDVRQGRNRGWHAPPSCCRRELYRTLSHRRLTQGALPVIVLYGIVGVETLMSKTRVPDLPESRHCPAYEYTPLAGYCAQQRGEHDTGRRGEDQGEADDVGGARPLAEDEDGGDDADHRRGQRAERCGNRRHAAHDPEPQRIGQRVPAMPLKATA